MKKNFFNVILYEGLFILDNKFFWWNKLNLIKLNFEIFVFFFIEIL